MKLNIVNHIALATIFAVPLIAAAAPRTAQPAMNNFNSAFYRCDGGAAFNIAYDAKMPKAAKLTTSNNSKNYNLKRAGSSAMEFVGGGVKFSTDGNEVKVEGTEVSLDNCKLQN